MRFFALLRKELRECLPWMLLAAVVFFVIGGFVLRIEVHHPRSNWYYSRISPGTSVDIYRLLHYPVLSLSGVWLFLISIGLGLALGVQQFWMAYFTKVWSFELYRSVSKATILSVKICAAITAFILTGIVWIVLYRYTCRPGLFTAPPSLRNFVEGWIFIALGFVIYLGTALVSLRRARWYTTKIFGLVFATLIIFITIFQWNLSWAFTALIFGVVILLSQITYTFLNREF